VQIYSDGDIFDGDLTKDKLRIIARHSKNMTVDVAVLNAPGHEKVSSMDQVLNSVIAETHSRMMGIRHGDDAATIARDLSKMLLHRIRSIEIKTEPDTVKRSRLKSLAAKLDK
jgi:hypothetical protein